ncbi:MAG: hypothetical protein ACQGVC_18170 [Myxococcota bacterium]
MKASQWLCVLAWVAVFQVAVAMLLGCGGATVAKRPDGRTSAWVISFVDEPADIVRAHQLRIEGSWVLFLGPGGEIIEVHSAAAVRSIEPEGA